MAGPAQAQIIPDIEPVPGVVKCPVIKLPGIFSPAVITSLREPASSLYPAMLSRKLCFSAFPVPSILTPAKTQIQRIAMHTPPDIVLMAHLLALDWTAADPAVLDEHDMGALALVGPQHEPVAHRDERSHAAHWQDSGGWRFAQR